MLASRDKYYVWCCVALLLCILLLLLVSAGCAFYWVSGREDNFEINFFAGPVTVKKLLRLTIKKGQYNRLGNISFSAGYAAFPLGYTSFNKNVLLYLTSYF